MLLVLLLSLCSSIVLAPTVTIPNQDHLIFESIGDPQTVDPAWSYDTASGFLIFNVYDTLINFEREDVGVFSPSIATDWSINQPPRYDAPEGTNSTWYFNIRGTSGPHGWTSVSTVSNDPRCSWWSDPKYTYQLHITSWDDTNSDGKISVSDQIDTERICDNWDGVNPNPVYIKQYWHVDFIGPIPGGVGTIATMSEKPVLFHDGSTLTTEDVEYSFERAMVQDRSGGPVWMLNEPLIGEGWPDKSGWPEDETCIINQVVGSNSTHVWLNLAMPYPPFMQILSQTWASIVNKDFCIAHGDWDGDWTDWKSYEDPEHSPLDYPDNVMCGTGPYMGPPMEDSEIGAAWWTHGVEWSIVRFTDYWDHWPAESCSSYVNRCTEKVVYEWGTRKTDFEGGYADAVYVPRPYLPAMIQNWPAQWPDETEEYKEGIRCLPGLPTLQSASVFFNLEIAEGSTYVGSGTLDGDGIPLDFFSDVNIRRAFAHCIDYDTLINEVFWGEAEQPHSCVINGIRYSNDTIPLYDLDLDKATEYFQAAADTVGGPAEGVDDIGFKMTVCYNTGNVERETTADMLKTNVEAIFATNFTGTAEVTKLAITWPTYLGELVNYPTFHSLLTIFIIGWLADYPDPHNWVVPYMHTYGDFSYFQSYHNETVDALIGEGIITPDGPERKAIYDTLQMMYYQDVPSVCTAQAAGRHWERDWYQGWYYNPIFPGTYVRHMWKGLNGDINGDDVVNILDTGVISSHWSAPAGPAGYDRIADVKPELQYPLEGVVDIYDAGHVSAHWLEEVG